MMCYYAKELSTCHSSLFKGCLLLRLPLIILKGLTYDFRPYCLGSPTGIRTQTYSFRGITVLETAVLTVTLSGMAPSLRADRRPPGSEPDVQTATLRGYLRRRSVIRATAFTYIQLYHTLEQKF